MREWLLTLCGLLARTSGAQAAPVRPQVKADTPYPDARRQLIQQGFVPVHVLWASENPGECDADRRVCRRYSEVIACAGAGARSPCEFLFRHKLSGRYWIVATEGEPLDDSQSGMRGLRCCGFALAGRKDLDGLVILTPAHRRVRFSYAKDW
jgi:hypothetical protein